MSFHYGYYHDDSEVTFTCDDKEVFKDICDYIERYLDAEKYRSEPHQVTVYQKKKGERY